MDQRKVIEAVKFLTDRLRQSGLAISKILLFGSHTCGTSHEESDIDIAIISDDFKGKTIFERASMTKDAEIDTIHKFVVPLDIVTLTNQELESETSHVAGYAREGEIVYAA
ncbi:MAG: nucleotidyltransferase domain-containing protein [Phycisphaerae bacterium]